MRSRESNWFEVGIRYQKTQEDGSEKSVTEKYAIDALSFTEGENAITEEMAAYISGEYEVKDIKKAKYKEICFSDDEMADRFYKAKIQFITIDEKTEKEKRSNFVCLVQASTLNGAIKGVDEMMGGTMTDYTSVEAKETKIMDVIEYTPNSSKEEAE